MTNTMSTTAPQQAPVASRSLFISLTGLAAAAVLLQGLWAGVFLQHDGARDGAQSWITAHARGGEVALALAVAATVVALVRHRERRDLWIGSAGLTLLLVLESFIGGLIVDQGKDVLTAVHVPLAMALMGLVVWLPLRAARQT